MSAIVTRFSTYKAAKAAAAVAMFLILATPAAHAQGLTQATGFLETIHAQLRIWAPIIAGIAGIVLIFGWWFHMVQKDTLIKWLIGLVLVGSMPEIIALFT